MKIVTTPMCEEIVKLSGVKNYSLSKNPTVHDGDLAILLSESNTNMDAIRIKLNTPSQIFESIKTVSNIISNNLSDEEIHSFFDDYNFCKKYLNSNFKRNINVKVYSNFLKDIVFDMGFNICENNYEYVIYPDYLRDKITEKENLVEIPSHNSISKNPFKKIEVRYEILENLI